MNRFRPRILAVATLLAASASLALSRRAAAEELPAFRQGMWEFDRTVEGMDPSGKPQTFKVEKCTSPSDDMKQQDAMLRQMGCTFSAITRTGNAYTFEATCNVQGQSSHSKSTLTAESDSAYTIAVESQQAGMKTHEKLIARRTGDCKK